MLFKRVGSNAQTINTQGMRWSLKLGKLWRSVALELHFTQTTITSFKWSGWCLMYNNEVTKARRSRLSDDML